MTTSAFDLYADRVANGERLTVDEIAALAESPDILGLGMLADTLRRRLHDARVTYVRVANCSFDESFADAVPPDAREVRITGAPDSLDIALTAVESARAVAGARTVSGFTWADVQRLIGAHGISTHEVLERLRRAGLDAVAHVPLDSVDDIHDVVETLVSAGYERLRLSIDSAPGSQRTALLIRAAELQHRSRCIQAINPLPARLNAYRPTTGYEDVKMVAIARLVAPDIPSVQIDWLRYGPKLAQVALTFGADDLDNVSPAEESGEGRRRAPLAEVRRNIEAAGFEAIERDGRFAVLA